MGERIILGSCVAISEAHNSISINLTREYHRWPLPSSIKSIAPAAGQDIESWKSTSGV